MNILRLGNSSIRSKPNISVRSKLKISVLSKLNSFVDL